MRERERVRRFPLPPMRHTAPDTLRIGGGRSVLSLGRPTRQCRKIMGVGAEGAVRRADQIFL